MPAIQESAPRVMHAVNGVEIEVPYQFTDGHELTANEAKFLNRTLASTICNYYAGDMRRAVEAHNKANPKHKITVADLDWDHQAEFDAKFTEYELGVSNRGEGGGAHDPVARAMRAIAAAEVKKLITAKGLKIGAFFAAKIVKNGVEISKFDDNVAQFIERNSWVRTLAERQVEEQAAMADEIDAGGLDLDLPDETAESEKAA